MTERKNSNVSSSKTLHQYCKVCKQQVESTRAFSLPQMTDSSGSTEVDSVICPECTQTTTIDSAGPLSLIDSSNLDVSPNNAEQNTHDEIEILLASSEVKVDNAIKNLSISMIKLQRQLPVVRKDIEDNLCNFKQILGMCRDNAFVAMQEFHSQPWEMTDLFHDIHASADNIVKACESTKVVMNRLNSSELLRLNNSIGTQIINLTKYAFSAGLNMSELNESAPPASSSEISPIVMINRLGIRIENKFGSFGASIEQLNAPHGFCLGADDEIVIADTNNHRIKIFAMNGTFKFQFGVTGTEEGQLQHPRKVAVMRASSKFVVCDRGQERSRMQIFSRNGEFINRIFITYINIVTCVAVTNDERIVVVDSVVPKVYFISEDGTLIRWFEIGMHVMEPSDVAISGSDLYICDYKGHRVAVFTEVGKFQHHIGNEQVTNYPNGICISDAGDICIADSHGNLLHITCFSRDGVLQLQLICPYAKISRCCGLKITSDGCTVTVAKNNHQVLVLDTRFKFSG